jgi:hypothetical protein
MPRGRGTGTAINLNTTNETVVVTLPNVSTQAGNNVDLEGLIDITPGTGATGVVLRIRRGIDGTGPVVGSNVQPAVVAGTRAVETINASDQLPTDVAGQSYVLTAQQQAATGNGTVNSAYLGALY